MLRNILSKTGTHFTTLLTLKTSKTRSPNHRNVVCHGQKCILSLVLRWAIRLLSPVSFMLRVALRWSYKTTPTTRLRRVKSTNISSVGSRRRAWSHTLTTCCRKNTPLSISQTSITEMTSRSSWLACRMIRLSGSGNYTLWRIWNGMKIIKALSNTGVETSSKAWDEWCGS